MPMRRLLAIGLLGAALGLTPAALASPPDQHWLGGLYDNADFDDVVLAIVEGVALVELQPPHASAIDEAAVTLVLPTDERVHASPQRSSNPPRAPPAS